jgi:hypothetical protein
MNFFKKALVATAVVASFSASAADVSSDPLKLSAEGVSVGLVAEDVDFTFDVVVKELHPSSSRITITFDASVDLDALAAAAGGAVTTDPSDGKGVSGDISFDYGTGSFTFDDVVINTTTAGAHTISWKVNLGNPLTANSAFRVEIGGGTVDIKGASSIAYSSAEADGTAIETGAGVIAETTSQFTFASKAPWDGIIERVSQVTFSKNADSATTDTDTVIFTVTNDEGLEASVDGATAVLSLEGAYKNGATAGGGDDITSGEFSTTATAAPALSTGSDDVTLALTNAEIGLAGAKVDLDVTFTGGTKVIPQTGDVDAAITFTGVTTAAGKTFELTAAGGEFVLDATVITVPYFPVGFEATSSSIHFANESAVDADVIVRAFDDNGEEYGPANLDGITGFADGIEANTVRKVSQSHIMELLSVPAGTKLSVTFNIDSNVGNVNAYAFSQKTGEGRQALVTTQQKGSDK